MSPTTCHECIVWTEKQGLRRCKYDLPTIYTCTFCALEMERQEVYKIFTHINNP